MTRPYAAFKVDPTINFDNCSFNESCATNATSTANFSRPMPSRPPLPYSPSAMTFSLPPLSRSSSSESLTGPATPAQDIPMPAFRVGPTISIDYKAESHSALETRMPSFFAKDQSQELDLRFSFEARSSHDFHASLSPPQLLQKCSTHDRHTRPSTAPSTSSQTSSQHKDPAGSQNGPTTVTSFAEFRQALAERQEARRIETAKRGYSAFPFLSQDPFQCPLTGIRPRSAKREVATEDESSRPVSRKSVAPSLVSSRSSQSFKRGLSKVKRLFSTSAAK